MKYLTVDEVRQHLGHLRSEPVLRLIRTGALVAVNVSSNPGGRAVWRIPADSLEQFLAARTYIPPQKSTRRTRRQKVEAVPEYV
jgi:hypothetical protein